MTTFTLLLRNLAGHWRAHLGLFLGAVLATAVLVGALAVGDSVRQSLRRIALDRLGDTHLTLAGGSRFFRASLAEGLQSELGAPAAAAIVLSGAVSAPDRSTRAPRAQVVGAGEPFWRLLRAAGSPPSDGAVLSARLAERLQASAGDEVLLRLEKPSLLSRDAPLSTVADSAVTLRLPVQAILPAAGAGRFGLQAEQIPPENIFVPLDLLARELEQPDRANTLLVGRSEGGPAPTSDAADEVLQMLWELTDAGLELRKPLGDPSTELRTDRVFLDPSIADAAVKTFPGARGILTYLVNGIRSGSRVTPYSMVAAMEGPPVPAGLADDEMVVNEWLASDLDLRPGSRVTLAYFVMGSARELEERTGAFTVRQGIPIAGAAADPGLMPPFPGVEGAANCRDWEPGIPVDLDAIRDRDEQYWDAHRGTPKAFINLKAGRKLWNNRFGDLTALRIPPDAGSTDTVAARLLAATPPSALGLIFQPSREQALAAGSQGLDFGQLFLGFSFFLIASALLLAALLFGLGIEARSGEVGLLLSLGLTPARVRAIFLMEGALVAGLAALPGAALGLLYTRSVIAALTGWWSGAVAGSALQFYWEPATVATGAVISFLVALLTIWLVGRRAARTPARELLASGVAASPRDADGSRRSGWLSPVALVGAGVLGAAGLAASGLLLGRSYAAGLFFGSGSLLLVASLAACGILLGFLEKRGAGDDLTLRSLAARGASRRRSRSLSAIALIACGSFLVAAVGAGRHDPMAGARERSSGTGGFAFYAESAIPIYSSLGDPDAQDELGLDPEALAGVEFVPLRLREGDQASCLNLNRAQAPRILGVNPDELSRRRAFTFSSRDDPLPAADPWSGLKETLPDGAIPAVGDENTVLWSLGKGVGESLLMRDGRGKEVALKIVGTLSGSILQGGLLISEEAFIRHFPDDAGYRIFLIDAPADRVAAAAEELTFGLENQGLDLMGAVQRLALFAEVENTYLTIFAVLGGLGLLLGTLGLAVVVLRNVLERRSELALLRALGYRSGGIVQLVFQEHALLLLLGLLCGVTSAGLAVAPALGSALGEIPFVELALVLGGTLAAGLLCTYIASRIALGAPLMQSLRAE